MQNIGKNYRHQIETIHFKGSLRNSFSPHQKTKKAIDLVPTPKDKIFVIKAALKLPPPCENIFESSLFKQGKRFPVLSFELRTLSNLTFLTLAHLSGTWPCLELDNCTLCTIESNKYLYRTRLAVDR